MKRLLAIFILAAFGLIAADAQLTLPDSITVQPPPPAVPANVAAFSGAWLGAWFSYSPTALIVEQISSNDTARVIYAAAESSSSRAQWMQEEGVIANGKLHFTTKHGSKIDYTLEPGGALLGRYQSPEPGAPSLAALYRVPSTNASAIADAARKLNPPWEEIRIPVHSRVGPTSGKTFLLQVTVLRQPDRGKHPIVIFNHGSTGPGIIPASYDFRGGNVAQYFRSLGYVVVVPMRKGRGQSEGPNVEEDSSLAPAVQLDSAIEDLHAVLDYLATQSDMDTTRTVMAGASRGGMLSVAYAGRYPNHIVDVVNFSGGWFGERARQAGFNFEAFRNAGRTAKIPMLWLYADDDSLFSVKYDERMFSAFQSAGGHGELVEVRNVPGDGHALASWVDRWQDKARDYLGSINK